MNPRDDLRAKVVSTALVFIAFASIFIALRSNDMYGVDGAIRCLDVYRRDALFFHDNNHMLYPADVLVWSRIVSIFTHKPTTPDGFFAMVQVMNCLAGAACLAMLFYLTFLASSSQGLSVGVAAAYGFSRAFLLHSTNAAEPMMGLFWSFLALCCAALALKYRSGWPLIGSGLLFGLAMATYQSTILLAPAAIVLFWLGRAEVEGGALLSWPRARDAALFVCGGVIGIIVIFGLAYRLQGIRRPAKMFEHFFVHTDSRAYLGVGTGKTLNLPIGMVRNIFPVLLHFVGIRDLMAGPRLTLCSFLLVLLSIAALFTFCAARLVKGWSILGAAAQIGVLAAFTGLIFTMVPAIIWDPNYDKLWLQPLACLAFLVGIALQAVKLPKDNRLLLAAVIPCMLFAGFSFNFTEGVHDHFKEDAGREEAARLAPLIAKCDLVVGDWDRVSIFYSYIWAIDGHFISLPGDAVEFGPTSISRLDAAIRRTHQSGGHIFFLGILDETKTSWDSFMGSRCGVPFSAMDVYRKHSVVRARFDTPSSRISLREFTFGG
jgi:hypothetical protein